MLQSEGCYRVRDATGLGMLQSEGCYRVRDATE